MNKLYDSLLIIQALDWSKFLKEEDFKALMTLKDYSKLLTDNELSKEDWDVVHYVSQLLQHKVGN